MQVAVRSYLTAGVAAVWAGTIAVTPHPDIAIPAHQAPIRLTGVFADLVVESVAANRDAPEKLYQLVRVTAPVAPEILIGVLQQPDQAVGTVNNLLSVGEALAFGTLANGAVIPAGIIDPDPVSFSPVPEFPGEFTEPIPSLISDTEEAGRAIWVDGLTEAGAPRVIATSIVQSHRIGVTVIQAQGLVRSASLGAVQGVVTAAIHNGDVEKAFIDGGTDVLNAVFGDPDLDGKPAGVAPDPDTGLPVASTKRLGAIKSVATGFRNAGTAVSAAVKHDLGTTTGLSPRHLATRPQSDRPTRNVRD
jgi:hypothetical protein